VQNHRRRSANAASDMVASNAEDEDEETAVDVKSVRCP
jgi:hypothetical protein